MSAFQLVMSHIHDEARSQRQDSDSCVGPIEDGLIAIEAFQAYLAKLSKSYGIDFTLTPSDGPDSPRVLGAWAAMPEGPHGPSNVYVEIQKCVPHTDVERIVDLMHTKARYSFVEHL